jgi:hypothetical protein
MQWIQAAFKFETINSTCQALVSLVQDGDGEWKIWLLRSILMELKGTGELSVDSLTPQSTMNGINERANLAHFDCVVVGGGQAGLSVGGRLKALGLRHVVLEKYPEVGDSWNTRYDSCKRKFNPILI